jgi:GTP-binding protein
MSYQFLDEARIFVKSGEGGNGMISFRREKFVPRGGPDGGDGGKGGDVVLVANQKINTLRYFGRKVQFRADNGENGGSTNKTGASASDLEIEVPVGTLVRTDDGELIADLARDGQRVVVAKGGRGGRGNARFKSSTNQAPRTAEKGEPSVERWLRLELKLVADVGIVGMPNAGKSTLLSVISNAKPRIADYPFTTLVPNLGLVRRDYKDMVVADIPGIIEGAHQGVGLGLDFLRHVQRTRVLIHMLDATSDDPMGDFHQINAELSMFDASLTDRPTIIAINKLDLPDGEAMFPLIKDELQELGYEDIFGISAVTQQNTEKLVYKAFEVLEELPEVTYEPTVNLNDEEHQEELPVYSLEDDEMAFDVEKIGERVYRVTGKAIERAAAMTYWDVEDALMRFQRILEATGISDALIEAGVQAGDTVYIGEIELEWSE